MHPKIEGLSHSAVLNHYGYLFCQPFLKLIKRDKFLFKEIFLLKTVWQDIGKWKYIIVTDLLKPFYPIPLKHDWMIYCRVITPFKGVRVYTQSLMGMPESETSLKQNDITGLGWLDNV